MAKKNVEVPVEKVEMTDGMKRRAAKRKASEEAAKKGE